MNYSGSIEPVVVIDFETSGMSPEQGDRAIEVGAVLIREGEIADRFQSLINPGFLITQEIKMVTGINNQMLAAAPTAQSVMSDLARFIGTAPLVAHNASFDQKFLEAELTLIGKNRLYNFGCTLLLAKRLYPEMPNHKLETLVRLKGLATNGQFHRALADAEMTAALWLKIVADLQHQYGFTALPFEILKKLGKIPYQQVDEFLQKSAAELKVEPPDTTGSLF